MSVAVIATPSRVRGRLASSGLPCGRRTPKGRARWYLIAVPEGREHATCEAIRRIVPADILTDAFVMSKERWMKRQGRWFTVEVPMYRGYVFAVTGDVVSLDRALSKLTFPATLVGSQGRAWVPVADEARDWFAAAMDDDHVIRSSTAVIENGALRVIDGPLMGQEERVTKPDRHKRTCLVRIADADGGFVECMPLDVPFKS